MATSGTITGTSSKKTYARIEWSATPGTGGSTVTATLYAVNNNCSYSANAVFVNGFSITINGSTKSGTSTKGSNGWSPVLSTSASGSSTVISHSVWVAYTGDKSITISGTYNAGPVWWGTATDTASATVALPKIGTAPSSFSISAPSTSTISETTSSATITWSASSSYSGSGSYTLEVSKSGGAYSVVSSSIGWSTRSYSYTLPTKTGGTTYKFRMKATNDIGSSAYCYSGTITVNYLDAPTIGTISTFNPYVSTSLSIPLSGGSQLNGGSFYRKAKVVFVNGSGAESAVATAGNPSSTGNTSVTATISTSTVLTKLGTTAYSSSTFKVYAWSENSNGTKSSYSSKTFTVNINTDNRALPSFSTISLSGGCLGYPASCFAAGVSSIVVTPEGATANRAPSGTTISYKFELTGSTTQTKSSASAATFSNLSSGSKTLKVTATDSRGLSRSVSKTVMVQPYSGISITNFSVSRSPTTSTSAIVSFTVNYSKLYAYTDGSTAGTQLNGIQTEQYLNTSNSWTNLTPIGNSSYTLTGYSDEVVYTIQVRASDKVKTTTYAQASGKIPSAAVGLAFRKHGVGIGCVPQSTNRFEVRGSSQFNGSTIVSGALSCESTSSFSGAMTCNGAVTCNGTLKDKYGVEVRGTPYVYSNNESLTVGEFLQVIDTARNKINDNHINVMMKIPASWSPVPSQSSSTGVAVWVHGFVHRHNAITNSSDHSFIFNCYDTNGRSFRGNIYRGPTDDPYGSSARITWYHTYSLEMVYPVGAIYLSMSSTNPVNIFGFGTWELIEGRALIGAGSYTDSAGTAKTFTSGNSYGLFYQNIKKSNEEVSGYGLDKVLGYVDRVLVAGENPTKENLKSNMQPSVAVYIWRRTA